MPRRRKGVTAAQQRERSKRQHNTSTNNQIRNDQVEEELLRPIREPGAFKVICGTLHQGDTRFQYPGIQCAYISLIALCRMTFKDPQTWTARYVDSCVIDGNAMFMKHCETLDIQPKMLMANELPNLIHFSHKSFACKRCESDIEVGLLKPMTYDETECVSKDIKKALSERLSVSQTCLLFCGGLTIAVAKVETHLYAFDPHSRGKDGLLNPVGTAVLMVFDHLNDLVCYIEELFLHSLKLQPSEQFELVPFSISQPSIQKPVDGSNASACKVESRETIMSFTHNEPSAGEASIQTQQVSTALSENKYLDASKAMDSYFEDQKKRQILFQQGRSDTTDTQMNKKRNT